MTRIRVAVAAFAAALVATPAASAATGPRASLRVETPAKRVLGAHAPLVGAARAYRATDGTAHALPPDTVLGQLVAAAGSAGLDVGITQFSFGPFVSSIGGVAAPSNGFWALYVDNVASEEGAAVRRVRRGTEVVWVLDPDFAEPGPTFLDLDRVRAVRPGTVRFRVWRGGTGPAAPARGARVRLAGRSVVADARGYATVRLRAGRSATARATLPGAIRSEIVRVRGAG